MQTPLQISFHNMDPSAAIEERVREKAAKLERFHDRLIGCSVVIGNGGSAARLSWS